MKNEIRLRDVYNFIEASSCKTLVEAARKLEISQPALSESIKRLEEDCRLKLFYRSRSGISLTPAGKDFLLKAELAYKSYSDLYHSQKKDQIFNNIQIKIGCHTSVAQYSIPKALSFLKNKAPDYNIKLIHDLSRNIQSQIQNGLVDIGIVINASLVPDLVIQKLGSDVIAGFASPNYDFQNHETLICNTYLFQVQSILKKIKPNPAKVIHTESHELIGLLASEKIGIGLLPQRAVEQMNLKLELLKSMPQFKDEIYLVYRPEFGKIEAEKLVIEALRSSFR